MGYEADDLISIFDTLKKEDVWQYRYPSDYQLHSAGVRGIYLGNYVRWDPKEQHEKMIKEYDYQTSKFNRTFDCYDYVDCFNYMDLHDLLKLYKSGYSKVTDHASREIRFGRITRNEGLSLVRKYEQQPLEYTGLFAKWLEVEERSLNFVMDQHRNPIYWERIKPGEFIFKGLSTLCSDDEKEMKVPTKSLFLDNNKLLNNKERSYIIFGKGHP